MIETERYDKNGKNIKKIKRYPVNQREMWNCTDGNGILSDVLGSYSGTDEDGGEPVQDVDDL